MEGLKPVAMLGLATLSPELEVEKNWRMNCIHNKKGTIKNYHTNAQSDYINIKKRNIILCYTVIVLLYFVCACVGVYVKVCMFCIVVIYMYVYILYLL